ncbi:MAG: RNA polymerase sigma factor [Bacteroidales bacterium]
MMDKKEKEIIEKIQDPSQRKDGFSLIVKHYSERLYWQIRRMVLCHDDANDILQNVFLKAWINIELFRGEAKLSTWLYRIAINESITFLSNLNKKNSMKADDPDEILLSRLETDPYFDGDELQLKLQKAILSLPEKQRIVFNMRYFDELKYEEISAILGTSVGALKASYHHASKKVEEFIIKDI